MVSTSPVNCAAASSSDLVNYPVIAPSGVSEMCANVDRMGRVNDGLRYPRGDGWVNRHGVETVTAGRSLEHATWTGATWRRINLNGVGMGGIVEGRDRCIVEVAYHPDCCLVLDFVSAGARKWRIPSISASATATS